MHCGYCQILAVLRPVSAASAGTASTASARSSSKIRSISAAYWEYETDFNHLSVHHRFDNFIRILLQTALTVHGWSHKWELKQTTGWELEYSEYWRYFGSICCEHSKYLRVQHSYRLSTPAISDVCTAGSACTRGSVLLIILPVAVFGPSVVLLLMLPVRAVFRTLLTRVLQCT